MARGSVPLIPVLALVLISGARGARDLRGAASNCSQQGLSCSFSFSNCLDPDWVVSHSYTPSGPELLDLRIVTRPDPEGNLLPVISATWRLRDDGSIMFLKASELQVVVVSTNQNFCVRYSYNNTLPMRNLQEEQWTLRSEEVVVDPGQSYKVTLRNIPKPELDHSDFSPSRDLTVPDCSDPVMKTTLPCIQSGFLWSPDLSVVRSGLVLTVEFSPDPLSQKYDVFCRCGRSGFIKTPQGNSSRLSASFSLDLWVISCCSFNVQVLSYFPGCGNDCRRHNTNLDFCPVPTDAPDVWRPLPVVLGVSAALMVALIVGLCVAVCRRSRGGSSGPGAKHSAPFEKQLEKHPTLLLIYSRDHPLYVHVVLQLSAFLQAQCGIRVLLDLLDSTSVSQVGVVRWLELQRQKLGPDDKVLVLCSRGVQSKWRSMCGQGHVVQQPDDLIGPFLNLFLSELHSPQSRGRYIAAFFEDFGSERDVPSFFDIAVKYKLMKHFEELYLRVLDIEKYEPSRVNHVQGIGPDEYWTCESGRALQLALADFSAFQRRDPDWSQRHETELADESSLLLENTALPQILEFLPIVRDGAQVFANDVLASESTERFYVAEPEPRREASLAQNEPLSNPGGRPLLELLPDARLDPEPFVSELIPSAARHVPAEDEEAREASAGQSEEEAAAVLQHEQNEQHEQHEQNEQNEQNEAWKGQSSASDQGYSSDWTEPDSDHMRALLRLQQELMSGICHFETE